MKTSAHLLDRIASSAAVNKTAAKVAFARGESWAPTVNLNAPWFVRSDVPLPTLPAPHNAPKLSGQKFGRFTVVGYAGKTKQKGSRWVVRCLCGAYEHRRTSVLKAGGPRLMCSHCDKLEEMKSGVHITPAEAERRRKERLEAKAEALGEKPPDSPIAQAYVQACAAKSSLKKNNLEGVVEVK